MDILKRNTVVFLNRDTEHDCKHAYRVIDPEYDSYQIENLCTGDSLHNVADTEFRVATEEEKVKLFLNGDDYKDVDPAFDTTYTIDNEGYIVGVQAIEDDFIVELNKDNVVPNTYYYYIEYNYNSVYATLRIEEKDVNKVEFALKDLLYSIGSVFPFEPDMIKNIGKYFKPFKDEVIPNTDIVLNLLQFLENKEISYANSTYEEITQALDEYRHIKL